MKKILALLCLSFLICCSNHTATTGDESTADSARIDTVFSTATSQLLIDKADTRPGELTQRDYAEMIEQTRDINRLIVERLRNINFRADLTDEEIARAMQSLKSDTVMPVLEEMSRSLLTVLQNANLDEANRDRYASMMADAEKGLRSLR